MNDCCQDPANLERHDAERPDVVVKVCKVCGCRHIEFGVDPVEVGVKVSSL